MMQYMQYAPITSYHVIEWILHLCVPGLKVGNQSRISHSIEILAKSTFISCLINCIISRVQPLKSTRLTAHLRVEVISVSSIYRFYTHPLLDVIKGLDRIQPFRKENIFVLDSGSLVRSMTLV